MKRSVVAALLALLMAVQPVSAGWVMNDAERYLAYRVRVTRGEETYKLRQWVIDIAHKRAVQLRTNFSHYCGSVPCADRYIPDRCWWGEILAWTSWPVGYKDAVNWAIRAWLDSPGHKAVLLDRRWDAYGTGMVTRAGGGWYMAVIFIDC